MFAKCLEYLKKIATDVVNERHLKSQKDNPDVDVMYRPSQIQWVITIPAIWSISAKEFMRKAAYKVTYICKNSAHSYSLARFVLIFKNRIKTQLQVKYVFILASK